MTAAYTGTVSASLVPIHRSESTARTVYLMVPEYAEHVDEDQGDEYDERGEDGLQVPVHLPTQQHCKNNIFNKVKKNIMIILEGEAVVIERYL
jgi:hypothetical protein